MSWSTVIVDVTSKPFREVARDVRDPYDHPAVFEPLACDLSRQGRLIRVFAQGQHVTPWRKRVTDPVYEAFDGAPTPDFAPIPAP